MHFLSEFEIQVGYLTSLAVILSIINSRNTYCNAFSISHQSREFSSFSKKKNLTYRNFLDKDPQTKLSIKKGMLTNRE